MKKILLYSVISVLLCSCNILKEPSAIKQIDFCLKGMRMTKKTEQTYYYNQKLPFVLEEKCEYFYVDYEKHKKENDTSMVNFWNSGMLKMVMDTMITQQTNTVTMSDLDSITGNILYSNKINHPVMGMQFISQFDWIIDRYSGKIYAKKIKDIVFLPLLLLR